MNDEDYSLVQKLNSKIEFLECQLNYWKDLCKERKELNVEYQDLTSKYKETAASLERENNILTNQLTFQKYKGM